MYSRKAWGGPVEPYISIKWVPVSEENTSNDPDPIVSMVIFEWRDYDLIGINPTSDSVQVVWSSRV